MAPCSLLIAIIISIVIFLFYRIYRFHTYWHRIGVKGPNLWTSLMSYTKVLSQNDYQWYGKYGEIIGFYEIFKRGLIINDPKLIRQVLVKDFDVFTNRRYYCFGHIFDSGIVLAKDDNWRRNRSVVSQAFTSAKLKSMFATIVGIGNQFSENLNIESLKGEFDIRHLINGFVIDVLCSCGFGIDVHSVANPNHPIVVNAKKVFEMDLDFSKVLGYVWPQLASLLNIEAIDSNSVEFFRHLSEEIMSQKRDNNNNKRQDLMQLLVDANQDYLNNNSENNRRGLTLDEITATAITIFIGGYDTTAATIAHICYYLSKHEDCQQILFEELSQIHELSEESLTKCEYLNAVIKETLRVAPVGCRFDREAAKDYRLADTGIVVPKGCLVTFSAYSVHHNKHLYPKPFLFRPERFLQNQNTDFETSIQSEDRQLSQFSYLGWGLGPRMCVGMNFALNEIRIFVYILITRFKLSHPRDYQPEYPRGNLLYTPKQVFVSARRR